MRAADEHLAIAEIDAFVDHEVAQRDVDAIEQHVAECHACTLRLMEAMELKRATARAGRGLAPSAAALARLTAQVKGKERSARVSPLQMWAWTALAACLLLAVSLAVWNGVRERQTLTAAMVDQHLSTLAASATPQVISTDRHTVKPWFQGRLPFTFNLPDASELPADTVLDGADLAYVRGQPAALLLFRVRQHHVSVFVTQNGGRSTASALSKSSARSGFNVRTVSAGHLQITGVSDVDGDDLDRLMLALAKCQADD